MMYRMLEADTSHPTAEAIHERLREVMPTVSLTTVYKTLNDLAAAGELKRFDAGGVAHYDPDTSPHGEAVCLKCGKISDVPCAVPDPAGAFDGFQVTHASLTFLGYCQTCLSSTSGSSNHNG